MATTDYKLGWKYYAKFTSLHAANYKYIHLPVNSTFSLPSDFRMEVGNIFYPGLYYYIWDPNSLTVSGYDMSVTGEQTLTISYTCPNGQVLTSTEVKLIVFGTSTWRTVWSGNTTVKYEYDVAEYLGFVVDGVKCGENKCAYVCQVNKDTFNKYIGKDYIRKLRITCSVEGEGYYTLYIANTEKTFSHKVLQSYEFDFNYKIQGRLNTTYDNYYKTIAVNRHTNDTNENQMIVGHLDNYSELNNNVLTYSLICFDACWDGGSGSGVIGSSRLTGQNITITKIEVQE